MSQWATYYCKIKNPDSTTLDQAIDILTSVLNGQISERLAHDTTIKLPEMDYPIHIGIRGKSTIYVESNKYCDREKLKNLTQQVQQLYFVIAHKAAMEAMGYQVNINQNEAGDFIVQGVTA